MKKVLRIIIIMIIFFILLFFLINFYVIKSTKNRILSDFSDIDNVDAILVLGAKVKKDNTPSPMLEDRILGAIELYNKGVANKIIMSGDHGTKEYDEVNAMKEYVKNVDIPSNDIFMDHAGFSTYDSIYRAKAIFKVKKMIIVTQEYHLYRALYIAKSLGIDAYGYASNPRDYSGQSKREVREILARDKDFIKCIFKPNPKFLGDEIPVSGNGDITNDK
jgi:vancomycin permeability regulator SanA